MPAPLIRRTQLAQLAQLALLALALPSLLLGASEAAAQYRPRRGVYRESRRRLEGPEAGFCGQIRRGALEDGSRIPIADERDGLAFRDIGSPARDLELELELTGGGLPTFSAEEHGGATARGGAAMSLVRFDGGLCMLGRLSLPFPLLTLEQDASRYNSGNFVFGPSFLYRTPFDTYRIEAGLDLALPTIGQHRTPLALQTNLHAALLQAVDEDVQWLGAMEWGMRGRLALQARARVMSISGNRHWFWDPFFSARLSIGYARLVTAIGPREGLLGGLRLRAGFEFRKDRHRHGYRLGVFARLGYGTLWPTEVLLPMQFGGFFGWAFEQVEVHAEVGAVATQLIDPGGTLWVRGLLTLSVFFDLRGSLEAEQERHREIEHGHGPKSAPTEEPTTESNSENLTNSDENSENSQSSRRID